MSEEELLKEERFLLLRAEIVDEEEGLPKLEILKILADELGYDLIKR